MENNENSIDISLYKLFYLVCQQGSFSKTAKILDLTQPSISYNIKKLEDELGVTLFERGSNLIMTPEAEELFPYVEEALNSLKNGERKINDLVHLKKGQISIGIPSHIGVFLLTDIIKKFNLNYPNIKIKVICKPTKELLRLLTLNELDLLIDCSPLEVNANDFIIKKITKEKCAFACHYKNKSLLDRVIELKEIAEQPLIVPLRTSSSTKNLISVFNKKNVAFEPSFEITTSDMIAEMVEQEIGIGFLFEKTINKYQNLRKININCVFPEFDVFLLYKNALLSTTAQEFIRFMNKNNL